MKSKRAKLNDRPRDTFSGEARDETSVPRLSLIHIYSAACPTVGICDETRRIYGVQFHPEVNHTEQGSLILRNFLYRVCKAAGDWTMADYRQNAIRSIREKVGSGKALLALSGGVDLSLIHIS